MADRVYLEKLYLIPRLSLWVLLLLIALLDGWRHRHIRSRGWQLYAVLLLCTFLFVLRDAILLIFALEHHSLDTANMHAAAFGAFIFFTDLSESVWIGTLLAVSAGYCITRSSLGPHTGVVIVIPSIFFVTSIVTDFVFYSVAGFNAFSADPQKFYEATTEGQIKIASNILFFICLIASIMSYLLSWFYIFDTITTERLALEKGPQDPSTLPAIPISEGHGEGHVAEPIPGAALLEPGMNASHLYGDVNVEDLDARKTIADKVADREKALLLKRFFYGVCGYVIASMAAFLLPVFLPSVVDRTILIIQNVVLLLFVAALLFTFRMREGNQYLNLVEADAADTALVDDDHEEEEEGEGNDLEASLGRRTVEMGRLPHQTPVASNARNAFVLDDVLEEQEYLGRTGARNMKDVRPVDPRKAGGVEVMPLPSPKVSMD